MFNAQRSLVLVRGEASSALAGFNYVIQSFQKVSLPVWHTTMMDDGLSLVQYTKLLYNCVAIGNTLVTYL